MHLTHVTVAAGCTYLDAFGNLFTHGHGGQNHEGRGQALARNCLSLRAIFVSNYKVIST